MRQQNGRRILIAGIMLLSVLVIGLTGCLGGREPLIVPTGVAPTVAPTTEADEPPASPTPSPTVPPTQASTSVTPRVAISPTNGPAGTEIRAVAAGFRPNTTVTLGLGRQGGQVVTSTTAQSDVDGRLVLSMTVPDTAETGQHWLVTAQIVGQPVQAMSNLFEVIPPGGSRTVQVTPSSGTPGTRLQVTGSGFPAETEVQLALGPSGGEPVATATARTFANGELDAAIDIPASAPAGETWVVSVAAPGSEAGVLSGGVEILAAAAPTPVPAATATPGTVTGQTTQIYLIALEDAGQSGPQIGCGDSVVPVTVPIERTVAVLRASMEKLVSINDQYYGESGLYNALYQSDLTVGTIGLSAGHATIHLSGSLVIGGTCDAPRVKAQLEQTALQFSTVSTVSILVNGQPLDTVLSEQ